MLNFIQSGRKSVFLLFNTKKRCIPLGASEKLRRENGEWRKVGFQNYQNGRGRIFETHSSRMHEEECERSSEGLNVDSLQITNFRSLARGQRAAID